MIRSQKPVDHGVAPPTPPEEYRPQHAFALEAALLQRSLLGDVLDLSASGEPVNRGGVE